MYVTIHIYIYSIHATIHICKQTWLLMGSERNTTISCLPDESHPYQLDLFGVKPRKGPGPFWKRILGKHLTDDWKSTTCFSCCNLDPPPKWCQEKDPLRNLCFQCFWDFFAYKLCRITAIMGVNNVFGISMDFYMNSCVEVTAIGVFNTFAGHKTFWWLEVGWGFLSDDLLG